jgi:hypothetical protein
MRAIGEIESVKRDMDGNLLVTFAIEDTQEAEISLEKLKGKELTVEAKKHSLKRSLNANAYFWKLCDEIAKAIGSDKDTVYLMQLGHYGVFVDLQLDREVLPELMRTYRYVEEFNEGDEKTAFTRCYIGSSNYDSAEMARLIDGTVNDAKELGIETWSQEEIEKLTSMWQSTSSL